MKMEILLIEFLEHLCSSVQNMSPIGLLEECQTVSIISLGQPLVTSDLLDPIYGTQMTSPGLRMSKMTSASGGLERPRATSDFERGHTASRLE